MKTKITAVLCIALFLTAYPVVKTQIKAGEKNSPLVIMSDSMNRFAVDFYMKKMKSPGNIVFSPAGIYSAILMIHPGSAGDTKTEVEKILYLDRGLKSPHTLYGDMLRSMEARTEKWSLFFGNSLWFDRTVTVEKDYMSILKKNYSAEPNLVDFRGDAKNTSSVMNKWVEYKTMGRIKDLLRYGSDINEDTRFVLINTIYFKSPWTLEFEYAFKSPADFWIKPEKKIKVPMIESNIQFPGIRKEDYSAVMIPYLDNKRVMTVIVPSKKNGLQTLEKQLSAKFISDLNNDIRKNNGLFIIIMPPFRFTQRIEITDTLKDMGMNKTFSSPNLSAISSSEQLYFARAIQKVFIDVNKTGTEAAAATAFIQGATGMADYDYIVADRPYLFLIQDIETGIILFMGRITNPLDRGN